MASTARRVTLPARPGSSAAVLLSESRLTPQTCRARREASLRDSPLDLPTLFKEVCSGSPSSSETVLYLGYGSNLSAETFRGNRGIRPISQVNVVVPELRTTFNLPGIPYSEPCFANTEYRTLPSATALDQKLGGVSAAAAAVPTTDRPLDYHKDRWTKGLVGVVYEVTKADYAHIIATEGGGSGYQDVVVECYVLSNNPKDKVPSDPSMLVGGNDDNDVNDIPPPPFKAHTLLAPPSKLANRQHSYAQPSARYLKLITDGAAEHALPYEYQAYLDEIRPFRITTLKQRVGQFFFLISWTPLFLFIFFGISKIFLNPDGTFPDWLVKLHDSIISTCWASYDGIFKPLFGEGERTIGDINGGGDDDNDYDHHDAEKAPLVRQSIHRYGSGGRLETV